MNFLKKCATPFVALWRWIKETAWVQPLLIVGIIFAIIFSIPSITSGIQGLINSTASHIKYFDDHQLSLEGAKNGEENSDADKFFERFNEAQESWNNGNKDEARETMKSYAKNSKFFLFFVQEDCSSCSVLKDGLKYLEDNWSRYVADSNAAPFMFQSVIVDQTVDDDYYDDNDLTPMECLMGHEEYLKFAGTMNGIVKQTQYYRNVDIKANNGTTQSAIESNTAGLLDIDDFQTPTIMLVDLTDTNTTTNIVSEIFFTLESSDTTSSAKASNAKFLAQAWTYEETSIFGTKYRA